MERGLRLLALGALLGALCPPLGAAPAPPAALTPRCPLAAPPPPPTPPPLPPDCDPREGDGGTVATNEATVATNEATVATDEGTAATEGTERLLATNEGTVATNEGTVATNEATVATDEGTERLLATNCSGAGAGHAGDTVMVAPGGDIAVEGTEGPGVTGGPGDTLGHLSEVPGGATTTVTSVPAAPGGDKVLVATQSDVIVEGTEEPGVTGDPGDTLGHLNEVPEGATTVAGVVTAAPGSDKVLVATSGDVAMEGTAPSGVTGDPRDTLGHLTEVPGGATTTVTSVPASPGGDSVLVATQSDAIVEGTAQPDVTGDPGDTLGHLTEVPGGATTTVTSVPASQEVTKSWWPPRVMSVWRGQKNRGSPVTPGTLWATSLRSLEVPPPPREVTVSWWPPRVTPSWRGQPSPMSPVTLGTLWATSLRSPEVPPPQVDL
ncbi:uncharacterized protein ACIQIH_001860 isoform 2-T9 [Cyanocitta cristata]